MELQLQELAVEVVEVILHLELVVLLQVVVELAEIMDLYVLLQKKVLMQQLTLVVVEAVMAGQQDVLQVEMVALV